MKIKGTLTLVVILIMIFMVSNLGATVLVKMDIEKLTVASGNIVRGIVESVKCEKDEKTGRVYTYNTVLVQENVKGTSEQRVVIRQLGGTYNGMEMWISGTPKFEVGEEVLVFLKKDKNEYFLRGMGQGAFSIKESEGTKQAYQKTGNAAVYDPDTKSGKGNIVKAEPLKLELVNLLKQIKTYVNAEARKQDK